MPQAMAARRRRPCNSSILVCRRAPRLLAARAVPLAALRAAAPAVRVQPVVPAAVAVWEGGYNAFFSQHGGGLSDGWHPTKAV